MYKFYLFPDIIKEIIENRAKTYKQLGECYDDSRKSRNDQFGELCKVEEEIISKCSTGDDKD